MGYSKKSSDLKAVANIGFQHYEVATKSQDDSAFDEVAVTLTGFYPEHVRLYNSSDYDAYIKLNEKGAFTLPKGSILSLSFDALTKIEIKSADAGQTTTIEASVWGRTDHNI